MPPIKGKRTIQGVNSAERTFAGLTTTTLFSLLLQPDWSYFMSPQGEGAFEPLAMGLKEQLV
jgi:hypothetical protein